MGPNYFKLTISVHRVDETYFVEFAHIDPNNQAELAPVRAQAAFDLVALRQHHLVPQKYGETLTKQLFASETLVERFLQVETATQASASFVRVLIAVDVSAQELQSLRWELLQHPRTGATLSTSERVLLSRFMVSRDWQPIRLRTRAELRALIAVSAPNPAPGGKLVKMKLGPVDYSGELGRARGPLEREGVRIDILGGPGSPLTLQALLAALREGVDILYLVSHGVYGRSGAAALILQDPAGEARPVLAEDFAVRVSELQQAPRLVVLASCESAGTGEPEIECSRTSAQASLAGHLADAGVPGVIAMQGKITMQTVEQMMPTLFSELLVDGQIDRALAVARARVRDRPDAWMPALYSRLSLGRLWCTAGFEGDRGKEVWQRLRMFVANGKFVLALGLAFVAYEVWLTKSDRGSPPASAATHVHEDASIVAAPDIGAPADEPAQLVESDTADAETGGTTRIPDVGVRIEPPTKPRQCSEQTSIYLTGVLDSKLIACTDDARVYVNADGSVKLLSSKAGIHTSAFADLQPLEETQCYTVVRCPYSGE